MTRVRLIYKDKEVIKPVANVKQFVYNLRKTDADFKWWCYA